MFASAIGRELRRISLAWSVASGRFTWSHFGGAAGTRPITGDVRVHWLNGAFERRRSVAGRYLALVHDDRTAVIAFYGAWPTRWRHVNHDQGTWVHSHGSLFPSFDGTSHEITLRDTSDRIESIVTELTEAGWDVREEPELREC